MLICIFFIIMCTIAVFFFFFLRSGVNRSCGVAKVLSVGKYYGAK